MSLLPLSEEFQRPGYRAHKMLKFITCATFMPGV